MDTEPLIPLNSVTATMRDPADQAQADATAAALTAPLPREPSFYCGNSAGSCERCGQPFSVHSIGLASCPV